VTIDGVAAQTTKDIQPFAGTTQLAEYESHTQCSAHYNLCKITFIPEKSMDALVLNPQREESNSRFT